MKTKIYKYLSEKSKPVHHTRLTRKFLHIDDINDDVSNKLVESLLGKDSKFTCDDKGFWKVSKNFSDYMAKTFITDAVYTVVDVETTGGKTPFHKITEIAAVRVEKSEIVDMFTTLINPGRYIPLNVSRITGIYDDMVMLKPKFSEIMSEFLSFMGDSIFAAHNVNFDLKFINSELEDFNGVKLSNPTMCTVRIARKILPTLESRSVGNLARYFGITVVDRHRAYGDAMATAKILCEFLKILPDHGIETVDELMKFQRPKAKKPSARKRVYSETYY